MMEIRRMPIDQAKIIQILNEEDQYFVKPQERRLGEPGTSNIWTS